MEWQETAGIFPCDVWSNLCWWAGPQSGLMFVPSPLLGPQSDWCVPYLPLFQGKDSLWSGVVPVWATCTLTGLWCCFCGIWLISWGGPARYTGAGGAGSARFASVVPCGRGLAAWEEDRPVCGMDPQKHSIGCFHGESKFREGNWFPLGFWLGDG